MKPDDRLQEILNIVNDEARVLISDLTKVLKVSEMTIRRDVDRLVVEGAVQLNLGKVIRVCGLETNTGWQRIISLRDRQKQIQIILVLFFVLI